jgi:hypothetical protein
MINMIDQVLVESNGYKFLIERKTAEQWKELIGPLRCVGMLIDLSSIQFDEQLDFEMQELIEKEKEYNKKHRDETGIIDTNYLVKILFDGVMFNEDKIKDGFGTDKKEDTMGIQQEPVCHKHHGRIIRKNREK